MPFSNANLRELQQEMLKPVDDRRFQFDQPGENRSANFADSVCTVPGSPVTGTGNFRDAVSEIVCRSLVGSVDSTDGVC